MAVIDSGVHLNHEDLTNRIWLNPGESGALASNGVDDDANGYVDDWRGWDFRSGDNNPMDDVPTHVTACTEGHGTRVAGVVGAQTNNTVGIAGAANVKIMALRVCDGGGTGGQDILAALYYAANNSADIVVMSWHADPGIVDELEDVIADVTAARADLILVGAAGNTTNAVPPVTPCNAYSAKYPGSDPNVIGVAGTIPNSVLSTGSYWGSAVDVAAPMQDIPTTRPPAPGGTGLPTNGYDTVTGTSYAAPLVAGAIAIMLTEEPTLTRQNVMDIIDDTSTSVTLGPAHSACGQILTFGKLNAYLAYVEARDWT